MSTLLTKLAADFSTQLSTALSVGGTTATLLSQTDDDGNILPDGNYSFTLDGSSSNKEHIRCVKTGTSLTSIQSLSRQGALTTGVVRAHRVGCSVVITDWAQLKYLTDLLTGATDLDSSDPLKYDGTVTITNDNHLATKKYADDLAIAGSPKATEAVYGITKLSVAAASATDPIAVGTNDTRVPTQSENDALVGTSGAPSSTNKYVTNDDTAITSTVSKVVRANGSGFIDRSFVANSLKFGGDGTDGALAISSGTTTIDLAGAAIVTKNYTSISITGTGKLAFTNPNANGTVIILKSQGAVTLTSSQTPMIDASSLGGAGGTAVTATTTTAGNNGTSGISSLLTTGAGQGGAVGGAGSGGTLASLTYGGLAFTTTRQKYLLLPVASGGGSGTVTVSSGSNSGTSGAGGRGGGTLIIECAGAWNFTTASGISVAGATGGTGTSTGGQTNAAGGGGGAGGYFVGIYNTLTANSGTVTVSGGTGGNSDNNNTFNARRGGGGGALIAAGTSGVSSSTNSDKTGGDGATGVSAVVSNNDFT